MDSIAKSKRNGNSYSAKGKRKQSLIKTKKKKIHTYQLAVQGQMVSPDLKYTNK